MAAPVAAEPEQRDGEPERSIWTKLAEADVSEDWETVRRPPGGDGRATGLRRRTLTSPPVARAQAEVLAVLHWVRQIVGIVTGIVLGVAGVTGSAGNIGCAGTPAPPYRSDRGPIRPADDPDPRPAASSYRARWSCLRSTAGT